eukprot:Colp12_sorted_trinity150504_noHs@3681
MEGIQKGKLEQSSISTSVEKLAQRRTSRSSLNTSNGDVRDTVLASLPDLSLLVKNFLSDPLTSTDPYRNNNILSALSSAVENTHTQTELHQLKSLIRDVISFVEKTQFPNLYGEVANKEQGRTDPFLFGLHEEYKNVKRELKPFLATTGGGL